MNYLVRWNDYAPTSFDANNDLLIQWDNQPTAAQISKWIQP